MMPGSPLNLLFSYQRKWYADAARFKIGLWSRQTGKDFTTAAEAVADCYLTERNTWMIAAPSERQALESLNKAKDWAAAFGLAIEQEDIERDGANTLLKSGSIELGNKSRILAVPGRPDTVRGFSANLILTEFGFFDDPASTWKAVLPSITNPLRGGEKKVRCISTPNGKTGAGAQLYKLFEAATRPKPGARASRWSLHRVTIEDAVRDGLPIDIEELREALDDETAWAQEYLCEFLDGSNVLLPYELIALAEDFGCSTTIDFEFFATAQARLYCGIDFGRTNDPTVCWTVEEMGGILFTREVLVLRNLDSPTQQELLRARILAASRVCFDYTGPGIGLGDYFVQEHGGWRPGEHQFGKIELCTFTTKFKRELFPRLRQRFVAPTSLRIPVDIEVREDLHAMRQEIKNGEYSYSAPRTAAGHSDRCTALALAVRAADIGGGSSVQASAPSTARTWRTRPLRTERSVPL